MVLEGLSPEDRAPEPTDEQYVLARLGDFSENDRKTLEIARGSLASAALPRVFTMYRRKLEEQERNKRLREEKMSGDSSVDVAVSGITKNLRARVAFDIT